MDKLIPGLVLAALSGLTFVAYKHPASYVYFQIPLMAVITLVYLGVLAWEQGINSAHGRLMRILKLEDWKESNEAIEKLKILNGSVILSYFGIMVYLLFLGYLPRLLGNQ